MRNRGLIVAVVLASVLGQQTVRAADHIDGPRASADPAADITDVFTWMTADAARVIIAIDLTRNATTDSKFSDAVVSMIVGGLAFAALAYLPSPRVAAAQPVLTGERA